MVWLLGICSMVNLVRGMVCGRVELVLGGKWGLFGIKEDVMRGVWDKERWLSYVSYYILVWVELCCGLIFLYKFVEILGGEDGSKLGVKIMGLKYSFVKVCWFCDDGLVL